MRRFTTSLCVAALVSAVSIGSVFNMAAAAEPPRPAPEGCQWVTIAEDDGTLTWVLRCPDDDGQGGAPGGNNGGGKSSPGKRVCTHNGAEIPCSYGNGTWDGRCYVMPVDRSEWPSKDDPIWEGNEDGVIVECRQYSCIPGSRDFIPDCPLNLEWRATAPSEGPDPEALARQIAGRMQMNPIDIGIVPRAEEGYIGAVGLPVWAWVSEPSPDTYGPLVESDTAGNLTVTVTANVQSVTWDFGDGTVKTCDGPGTPYDDSYGLRSSPDCGHMYEKQGNPYTVTALSRWEISWEGGGAAGSFPVVEREAEAQIVIGEYQVLNR
jgi:hypothetical protein